MALYANYIAALLLNPAVALLPMMLMAAWFDVRYHRIPNWLTLGGILTGLCMRHGASGWSGVFNGLDGLMVGLLLFVPAYLKRGVGAGDVKLIAAAGCFLGPLPTLIMVAATLMIGGVLGVGVLIWHSGLGRFCYRYLLMLKILLYVGNIDYIPPSVNEPARLRFPFAVAIAAGTGYVLWRQGDLGGLFKQAMALFTVLYLEN